MDAKPHRPGRHLPSLGDENRVPPLAKTLHHRHKSTGNLASMASTGSFNPVARRTALGERNAAPREVGDALRDSKAGAAPKVNTAAVIVASTAQENRIQAKPKNPLKKAFFQPALRPPKARTIAPSVSMSHISTVATSTKETREIRKPHRTSSRSNLSWVYVDRDEAEPKAAPAESTKSTRAAPQDQPVAQAARVQPPIAKTNLEQEPVVDMPYLDPARLWSKDQNHSHKLRDEQQPSHNPSHEEVHRPTPSYLGVKPFLPTLPNFDAPSPSSPADDDTTEALYLDASEHLLTEEQIQFLTNAPAQFVDAPQPEPLPTKALPEPLIPERLESTRTLGAQPEVTSANFDNHTLPLSLVDDPAYPYLSESDEEDNHCDDRGYTTGGVTTVMFPPRITKKGQAELEAAKQIVESGRTALEIQEDAWDVSMVAEYGDDIFRYMREQEMALLPNPHYMDNQGEIQWSMRSVLMDWVVQVHTRFGLLPETLFLTVNYIDRFLSHKIVSLGKLQLVGATAIFIAAKYEEINCPSVQEIVYMVDGGYTTEEILKAERFMLSMLDFELGWPGPMSFLRRISKADDYDLETRTLAKYFLEVVIMDERFVASPPSYIAAGAHCLSRLILCKGEWTPGHVHYSGYTYDQLKPLVTMLLDCCRHARKHHSAVFEKYSDKRYRHASTYVEEAILRGYRLPFEQRVSVPFSVEIFDETTRTSYSHVGSSTGSHAPKIPIPTHG